jgi:hypothetical protein
MQFGIRIAGDAQNIEHLQNAIDGASTDARLLLSKHFIQ